MRLTRNSALALTLALLASGALGASGVFVYPQKGQSEAQQEKDEFECYKWARSNSGVDPSAPAQGTDPSQRARGTVGGAARGAAMGAAIGGIAGDAGKGAAAGAVAGGARGRRGAIEGEKAAQAERQNTSQRAFAACMDARGYSVK